MDGSLLNVEVKSIPFEFEGVNGALVFVRDITERKAAEQALRRFELLVENSRDIIFFVGGEDGRILGANSAACTAYGYSQDELLNLNIKDLRDPQTLKLVPEQMAKAGAGGILFETVHRRKDGTRFPIEVSSKGATIQGVRTLITIGRDITERKTAEAALAESDARLRLTLDSAQMGVWEHDLKTNHITGDETLFELFGVQPDQFDGTAKNLYAFVNLEDRASIQEAANKAIDCRSPYGVEFRITRPNGELRWMRSQGRVVCDRSDHPSRILGVVWDVSGIKHAQHQLLEATQRLDYLVTESPAVVFTYNLHPQPHLNYISGNLTTILGWRPEQFTENLQLWNECIHPADLPLIQEGLAQLDARGRHIFEYRFKDAQGKYHWIHDEQRVITGSDGHKEVVGAWWDVTDTKMAQEESRLLSAAIDQAAEIVLITNAKAEIVYVNPAFEKITEYSPAEVLGKKPSILKSGEHDHAFYQSLWAALAAGKSWHGLFINRKKGGRLYTEEATISPVFDSSGDIVNYVAVKRDVTREQELEKQFLEAQKMEAIGTLAGGIAHDFNNILAVILANAEILELSKISSESRDILNQIITASKRARQLVRQILAVSRRGRQDKIIMSLSPIVKETMGLLRASLPSTIRITDPQITADAGLIFADPTQMQQVLMNLCTNAGHAMEEKGGSLDVSLSNTLLTESDPIAESDLTPGDYVKFAVSDTGHGIPPWLLKKIFDPYFTTKETGKGTGLGLSVALGIVKSHGGTIKASSVIGKGTIFEVYLPRIKGEAPVIEKSELPLITGTGCVLFVDDEPALAQAAQKMLALLGYQVHTATSSLKARELFISDPTAFDLVITDLTMPDMTGTRLVKELREIRPDVPVILCTGFSDQVSAEMLESMGISGLLLKPITIHEIAHAIRVALMKSVM
jgi:PAS domain S-box-containing protein